VDESGACTSRAVLIVPAANMRTSYRDVFLLACCQALLLTNSAGLITMNGLVGYRLADTKSLATLGVTSYVLGSALATMPASLWMAKVGRRMGFMTGALINVGGCALAAFAIAIGSFPLYCVATAVIGIYMAIGLQYRFAAAEVSSPKDKPKAISLVLAGGIVGGFLGPESVRRAVDLFHAPFLGGFVVLAAYAIAALAVQSTVRVPPPTVEERSGAGRPLSAIVRQPVFIVAAMAGGLGYGLMNLLMTATPIAMSFCSHPFGATALVIEWHVVGMYAPGFVTGALIQRFGVNNVILTGLALMAASVAVALNGNTVAHFVVALALVGIGWNFMYVGGTTLLTEAYKPAEKARTQGANDFIVFATMCVSSLASGAMVSTAGWEAMNRAVLPFLAVIAGSVIWLGWRRRRQAAAPPTSAV
jgi:MFS family permease